MKDKWVQDSVGHLHQKDVKGCDGAGKEQKGMSSNHSELAAFRCGLAAGGGARKCVVLVRQPVGIDGSERMDWSRRKDNISGNTECRHHV